MRDRRKRPVRRARRRGTGRTIRSVTRQSRCAKPARRAPQAGAEAYADIEYRLSLLQDDLELQPEQRASWNAFAEQVRAYAGDLARERARAIAESKGATDADAIEHIDRAADSARNHATALEDISRSAKALYAVLTPQQRKLADARIVTIIAPLPRAALAPDRRPDSADLRSANRPER